MKKKDLIELLQDEKDDSEVMIDVCHPGFKYPMATSEIKAREINGKLIFYVEIQTIGNT